MEKKLMELVTGDQLIAWLVIAFLVVYFIYKEWPEFKRRITAGAVKESHDRTVVQRLDVIETDVREIKEKLSRDYDRINLIDRELHKNKNLLAESRKESKIMMKAMLGVLKGLQELGTNGPTKDSQQEIEDWLTEQSHKPDGED